ncbi:carboxylating nicotinate-nucleotide diphosphorylase [Methanobacterium paludis]|uniref:Nicotinate-nucleotide pyrophosphorylase [carboxylating] n=1 Tax=Methanobacterium paludis (strain DSM 25820 / JCM 18151 / SWAN1) TaxID=868131 RepID=F6D3C9_METPW|nr:carboxylating nicotinate-nucleotide diphosphorylase [Methanobacterium paludis]AEG18721.1 nicotinate-nucleotide pyrophosphorylase [Methanobacterium paludis]
MKEDIIKIIDDDIGFEDITTNALIPPDIVIKGKVICKEDGVVAGVVLASTIFKEFSILPSISKHDSEKVIAGDIIMEVEGDARTIITIERTVLNLLMRMSGIATMTSKIVNQVKKINDNVIVAGTRKTTPGLQFFEKDAIRAGGGDTHRYRLDDCVLIKDNHIAVVGDVGRAVELAKKYASFTKKIEIEVENREDALKAARAGADIIMFDNMGPDEIINVLSALENAGLRDRILIEVSGGINPDNVVEYAKTGVDVISMGYITHSAQALDISLDVV